MIKKCTVSVCIVLASMTFYGCNKSSSIPEAENIVKVGVLELCPSSTVEKMTSAFLTSPEWESGTGANGETFVNVSGGIQLNGKQAKAKIQFLVNKEKKEFAYHVFKVDGESKSEELVKDLFEKMCDATMVLTVASEEDVNKQAPGIWTCNWRPTTGKANWSKFIFNPDKTGEFYTAPVAADDWGEKGIIKWKPVTGKNRTTGKRWYGIDIPEEGRKNIGGVYNNAVLRFHSDFTFIFMKDDNILTLMVDPYIDYVEPYVLLCNRGDAFPFSK